MEEILNNIVQGEVLHITNHGTSYVFLSRSDDGGVVYSINKSRKTLPRLTIDSAEVDYRNSKPIDRNWYKNFNKKEYETRPCNFSVLKNLLNRLP